jgi:hypothetical protein
LYGAFFVKVASRHFGRPLHSILLFDPRREHSSVPTAYFHRRRAQRPPVDERWLFPVHLRALYLQCGRERLRPAAFSTIRFRGFQGSA